MRWPAALSRTRRAATTGPVCQRPFGRLGEPVLMGSGRLLVAVRRAGYAATALVMAGAMVLLGNWQWDRYQDRRANNARLQASSVAEPVPLNDVVPRPGTAGAAGPAPAAAKQWTMVTAAGRYDNARQILARNRTVNGRVGFEVLTPLVLSDGTAIIVNRGWIEAPVGDALARPAIAPAPPGQVTVVGRLHFSESGPRPLQRPGGRIEVRRISLSQLAPQLPYPMYGVYVLRAEQVPEAADALLPIPVSTENAWQSGAYAIQWWLFAAATVAWYVWAVYRALTARARRAATLGDLSRA